MLTLIIIEVSPRARRISHVDKNKRKYTPNFVEPVGKQAKVEKAKMFSSWNVCRARCQFLDYSVDTCT